MTIDRSLDNTSASDGAAWAADVDSTVNWLSGQNLGVLQNVAGTNALTANLNEDNGFSAWSTDAFFVLVPANNNTGAVTLQLQDPSASPATNLGAELAVRTNEGVALSQDDFEAGKAYPCRYDTGWGHIRVMVDLPSQTAGTGKIGIDPQTFDSSGTWNKPSNLDSSARVLVQMWGAGGGGGSGNNDGGGGGASYIEAWFDIDDLGASETVTIGTSSAGSAGGNSTFGSHTTAYGGGAGGNNDAGGGAGLLAKGSDANGSTGGSGGALGGGNGGAGGADGSDATQPGGGGGGGGGGSGNSFGGGGRSFIGGGGGVGHGSSGASAGTSVHGGDGGAATVNGSQPGGGGGGNGGAGGAGRCIVTVFG